MCDTFNDVLGIALYDLLVALAPDISIACRGDAGSAPGRDADSSALARAVALAGTSNTVALAAGLARRDHDGQNDGDLSGTSRGERPVPHADVHTDSDVGSPRFGGSSIVEIALATPGGAQAMVVVPLHDRRLRTGYAGTQPGDAWRDARGTARVPIDDELTTSLTLAAHRIVPVLRVALEMATCPASM